MKKRIHYLLPILLLLALAGLLAWPKTQEQAQASLVGMQAPTGNFQRADGSYALSFPQDFGPHNDYQSEWWYYTGNLEAEDGKHYGFQLTFFRRAILAADERTSRPSGWAAEQIYMAHFTLTDVPGQRFHYFERFSRGSAGLAGASSSPEFQVWLQDWSVVSTGKDRYRLQARENGISLDLELKDRKGPVLQGIQGLSTKGAEPGNASYYFSQPDLEASGKIEINNTSIPVKGTSWMDHEFSTSALGPELVGWDWFALQFDDGSQLMLYNLRNQDGAADEFSSGTLIRPDGSTRILKPEDFRITAKSTWRSPHSDANYPAEWTLEVPSEKIVLQVKPYLSDQELRVSFTYWEGAVQVTGTQAGNTLRGNGYVELTGYTKSMQGQL